ncbi:M16 family metallopeptidase [Syntrophus aciditrophicus]|uniref:Peptidase, M16 family n=1 Tax=Syntrophus aciditrophicus (strain SB) TaxID=56780 RepID=Q2LTL7_SYNAS|nr:pitrilysin family protein [Syntrophus aciditrophicus]ABC77426.1 peptidase, M16 family [Syntrophus aciditrophicus SB]
MIFPRLSLFFSDCLNAKAISEARVFAFSLALVSSLLSLLFFSASCFAYDLEKQVKRFTLQNGLKVLIVERNFSPTVSLYICHKVGAVDEPSGKTGTAHFLEHMLFKGTRTIGAKNYSKEKTILDDIARTLQALDRESMKGEKADRSRIKSLSDQLEKLENDHSVLFHSNEIDRLYTENGAERLNASTGQDVTTYQVSLPSNKLELWARIESERMVSPVFREFYSERKVIMEERRQSIESDPDGKLFEQFMAAAFIAHPYGRPILGWPYDMSYLNMHDLEYFLRRYHTPDNTVIAVVGHVDHLSVLRIIRKYFGEIPSGERHFHPVTAEPPQLGERRVKITFDANPRLIMGYRKPSLPSFDDYVFDVIQTMLTDGRVSRLYRTLVEEKALAETVWTTNGMPGARYDNLFTIYAAPRYPHTLAELEVALVNELERLKKEPVDQRELDRVKNTIKADFIRSLDSNAALAGMLSYFETVAGDYRYIVHHNQIIDRITRDDILRVAQKYFTDNNKTIAMLIPQTPSR